MPVITINSITVNVLNMTTMVEHHLMNYKGDTCVLESRSGEYNIHSANGWFADNFKPGDRFSYYDVIDLATTEVVDAVKVGRTRNLDYVVLAFVVERLIGRPMSDDSVSLCREIIRQLTIGNREILASSQMRGLFGRFMFTRSMTLLINAYLRVNDLVASTDSQLASLATAAVEDIEALYPLSDYLEETAAHRNDAGTLVGILLTPMGLAKVKPEDLLGLPQLNKQPGS